MSKERVGSIRLLEGVGVEGDIHAGRTIQHLSRVRKDPTQPNVRQVHLMHAELFDELVKKGFRVGPSMMGENITTLGVPLLDLPEGAVLRVGSSARVSLTGLRNPCVQLEALGAGLMEALLDRDAQGGLVRKAGVMGVVLTGGEVRAGDPIVVELPERPHRRLEKV